VQQHPMRLEQPDDSQGSMLLLSVPITIAHRIDDWSPLRGRHMSAKWGTHNGGGDKENPCDAMSHHLNNFHLQRSSECEAGSRDSIWCKVCGESFQLEAQYHKHVQFSANQNPKDVMHASLLGALRDVEPLESPDAVRREITRHLKSSCAEVLVLLEGVDAMTSANVQARHSYTLDDMVWDSEFVPCVKSGANEDGTGGVCIDFANFHKLRPAPYRS